MGKMNTLKGNYIGKVGQTVGAKWKNLSTERVFTKPANPNTQAQQTVRSGFKAINAFVALFADQIRYKSALDTSGMSVRNAIVKLNKEMVAGNSFAESSWRSSYCKCGKSYCDLDCPNCYKLYRKCEVGSRHGTGKLRHG